MSDLNEHVYLLELLLQTGGNCVGNKKRSWEFSLTIPLAEHRHLSGCRDSYVQKFRSKTVSVKVVQTKKWRKVTKSSTKTDGVSFMQMGAILGLSYRTCQFL